MITASPPLPKDYARRNLAHALDVAFDREGHLLTAGERWIIEGWHRLPESAAGLYARLLGRNGPFFRLQNLAYSDVPNPNLAGQQLVDAGLALGRQHLRTCHLLQLRTVVELRGLCKSLALPSTGHRAELLARLRPVVPRSALPGQAIEILHTGLFRRMARWFLQDHTGDLSRMVVADLGLIQYPAYTPTSGIGLFRDRRALLAYERVIDALQADHTETEWAGLAEWAVHTVATAPIEPEARRRFSVRRLSTRLSRRAIRAVERNEGPAAATTLYQRLLDTAPSDPCPIAHRLALCLGRLGTPEKGAAVCKASQRQHPDNSFSLTLERTGRRLARAAGCEWTSQAPFRTAPFRKVALIQVQKSPPRFESPAGSLPVEGAVATLLQQHGRRAIHGENGIWTTLFGLLFRPALFAAIEGMLPAPHLHGPLDLGQPGFADRRANRIADILNRIRSGEGPSMLAAASSLHKNEAIVGVDWSLADTGFPSELAEHLGHDALANIMARYATDYRQARSGMPDLCIFPGDEIELPGGSRLGNGLTLAEIKGPKDTVRDNQKVRHHQLLECGVAVEVWRVFHSREG